MSSTKETPTEETFQEWSTEALKNSEGMDFRGCEIYPYSEYFY